MVSRVLSRLVPVDGRRYRPDIDGLRAVAVFAVILFHFGWIANGYLGVDVFFVISGFLITGIIRAELDEGRFSMRAFYLRRIRRILPLALFISLIALVIGLFTMLPDDLENLAQSVVATNFSANNILQLVTTRNYWDLVNEYKPLMHTWSLGIEEQYYLLYPLLFVSLGKVRRQFLLPTLILLAVASLAAFLVSGDAPARFYMIQYRFYELAAGGIAALLLGSRVLRHSFGGLLLAALAILLFVDALVLPSKLLVILTVFLTLGVLVTANEASTVSRTILENKVVVWLGIISFSLYMWHQLLLAYTRYALVQVPGSSHLLLVLAATVLLSVVSYYLVEQPFRNQKRVSTRALLASVAIVFAATTIGSLAIYRRAGVIRDVPELDIRVDDIQPSMHAAYNMRVWQYDRDFKQSALPRVLVIGDSFGRDWVNVILESPWRDSVELSYFERETDRRQLEARMASADVVFFSTPKRAMLDSLGLVGPKLWAIGTKSFGVSSGYFYNQRGPDYCRQRTSLERGFAELNERLRAEWGDRYLDIIDRLSDASSTVPVFTPDCRFISQDAHHLTRAGAQYVGRLFAAELSSMARTP
jgi:peptidoglycan/LPS O-acetylase OafA/YrhL